MTMIVVRIDQKVEDLCKELTRATNELGHGLRSFLPVDTDGSWKAMIVSDCIVSQAEAQAFFDKFYDGSSEAD